MISLRFLGAMNEVGKSGILLDNGVDRILLDYGIKIRTNPIQFPLSLKGPVNAVFLSHAHLDHSGGIPLLAKKIQKLKIYSTSLTKKLSKILYHDNLKVCERENIQLPFNEFDVENALKRFENLPYRKDVELADSSVSFLDAGHIPGSSMILIETNGKRILYTGDFKLNETRTMFGCDLDFGDIDILITETTYSDREHPNRKKLEVEMIEKIKETVDNEGIALIAAFAVGRTQEVLTVLEKYGILKNYETFLDGLGIEVSRIIKSESFMIRERENFLKSLKRVEFVNSKSKRRKIIKKPSIIISGAGMLDGGPIAWYLPRLAKSDKNSLILTGYQVKGSAGRKLLDTGIYQVNGKEIRVKLNVSYFDFSAHAGRSELLEFIDLVSPEKIFLVHGEKAIEFEKELKELDYDATAPTLSKNEFLIK